MATRERERVAERRNSWGAETKAAKECFAHAIAAEKRKARRRPPLPSNNKRKKKPKTELRYTHAHTEPAEADTRSYHFCGQENQLKEQEKRQNQGAASLSEHKQICTIALP